MHNKFWVTTFTIVISALSLFYLSFTFKARSVEEDARAYAMGENGAVNFEKKQDYMDSLWQKQVYDLGFTGYTLKEVKEREINLGLDLRGGMHVTLEVSPVDILRALAGGNPPESFENALKTATEAQKNSQERFTKLFFDN